MDWKEGVWEYLPNHEYNFFLYLDSVQEEIVFTFGGTMPVLFGRKLVFLQELGLNGRYGSLKLDYKKKIK